MQMQAGAEVSRPLVDPVSASNQPSLGVWIRPGPTHWHVLDTVRAALAHSIPIQPVIEIVTTFIALSVGFLRDDIDALTCDGDRTAVIHSVQTAPVGVPASPIRERVDISITSPEPVRYFWLRADISVSFVPPFDGGWIFFAPDKQSGFIASLSVSAHVHASYSLASAANLKSKSKSNPPPLTSSDCSDVVLAFVTAAAAAKVAADNRYRITYPNSKFLLTEAVSGVAAPTQGLSCARFLNLPALTDVTATDGGGVLVSGRGAVAYRGGLRRLCGVADDSSGGVEWKDAETAINLEFEPNSKIRFLSPGSSGTLTLRFAVRGHDRSVSGNQPPALNTAVSARFHKTGATGSSFTLSHSFFGPPPQMDDTGVFTAPAVPASAFTFICGVHRAVDGNGAGPNPTVRTPTRVTFSFACGDGQTK